VGAGRWRPHPNSGSAARSAARGRPIKTEIARFWFEGPGAWNTMARTVATDRGLDARDTARVLALMMGQAVRGDHAVVHELLAGGPRERRLARLRRHFRSACEDGLALGTRVGQRTAKLYLAVSQFE
jgi:hypothetical protein